ncbi:MAG TPA: hypothetical protein VKU84_13480, partial [Stellaceae bacterium]|nr:hypothetical protein [Stellaceae bacterium]
MGRRQGGDVEVNAHSRARSTLSTASRGSTPAWAPALIILPLAALAFGLTAATLGRENFWVDELSSLYFSDTARSFPGMVREIWRTETNPPLYYVYLYLWRELVPGTDEVSIRAASLVPAALG